MTGRLPPTADLIDALRQDLPDDAQRERLRARLIGAGVAVGAGTATAAMTATAAAATPSLGAVQSGAAAAHTATATAAGTVAGAVKAAPLAQLGLWAKVATAVPGAAKLGAAAFVAAAAVAATAPVAIDWVGQSPQSVQPVPSPSPSPSPLQYPAPPAQLSAPVAEAQLADGEPGQAPDLRLRAEARPVQRNVARDERGVRAPAAGRKGDAAAARAAEQDGARPTQALGLAAEAELLERALRALADGQREQAAHLLAEHGRRYPAGALRTERQQAERRLGSIHEPGE